MISDVKFSSRPRIVYSRSTDSRSACSASVPVRPVFATAPTALYTRAWDRPIHTHCGYARLRNVWNDLKINSCSQLPVSVCNSHIHISSTKVNSSDYRNCSWNLDCHSEASIEVIRASCEFDCTSQSSSINVHPSFCIKFAFWRCVSQFACSSRYAYNL